MSEHSTHPEDIAAHAALEAIFDILKLPGAKLPTTVSGHPDPTRIIPRVVELHASYVNAISSRDLFRQRVADLGGDVGNSDYALPELVCTPKPQEAPAPPPVDPLEIKILQTQADTYREVLLAFAAAGRGLERFLCDRLDASMQREAALLTENTDLQEKLTAAITPKDPQ